MNDKIRYRARLWKKKRKIIEINPVQFIDRNGTIDFGLYVLCDDGVVFTRNNQGGLSRSDFDKQVQDDEDER